MFPSAALPSVPLTAAVLRRARAKAQYPGFAGRVLFQHPAVLLPRFVPLPDQPLCLLDRCLFELHFLSGTELREQRDVGADDRGDLGVSAGRLPVRHHHDRLAVAGDLDAALIPYDMAVSCEGCEIRAILGYEQLLLLGRRDAVHVQDLDNSTLVLPQKLQNSALAKMLEALLRKEDTFCTILYSDDFSEAEWIACSLDDAAAILKAQPGIRICFSITRSARHALDTAPYGLCLTVRKDYLQQAGTDYDAFERRLQDAVHYADEKRKKTVAMMASSGIAADEAEANLLYPYCSFRYMDPTTLE